MNAGFFGEETRAFASLAHRAAGARFRFAELARRSACVVLSFLELLELERELFDRRGDARVFAGDFYFDLWSWRGSHFWPPIAIAFFERLRTGREIPGIWFSP